MEGKKHSEDGRGHGAESMCLTYSYTDFEPRWSTPKAWALSLTTTLPWRLVCTAQNKSYNFLGIEISGTGGTLVPGWVWGLFWVSELFSQGSASWSPPMLLPKWVLKEPVFLVSHHPYFSRDREFLRKGKVYGNPSQTQDGKDHPHYNVHTANSSYVKKKKKKARMEIKINGTRIPWKPTELW